MHQHIQATLRIREMILSGDLAPGQRVQEASIAERLGISRTPVRQALPALAEEGLLIPSGRRGYAVRIFTIDEIDTALDIRASLEGMAARILAEKGMPPTFVRALKMCLGQGDELFAKRQLVKGDEFEFGQVNVRFHNAITNAADNSVITGILQRMHRIPFVTPAVIAFDNKTPDEMYDLLYHAHTQHHAIANALEHGQGARVEALFREHVYCQKRSMNLPEHRPGMLPAALATTPNHASY